MIKILTMIYLYFIAIIPILFVVAFIDRTLPSGKGFSSYNNFLLLSLLIVSNLPVMLLNINRIFNKFFGSSIILFMISYHVITLFIINILIVSSIYLILFLDYILKNKLKSLNVCIISSKQISYKLILQNPKLLRNCLIISYFLSFIVIIFIIPNMLELILQYDKEILASVKREINLYQQLFVFSIIPILFNYVSIRDK